MERVMKIAMILLEQEAPVTVDEIAAKLKVSNKTIRNDYHRLREIVQREGLKLVIKTGVGTTIEGPAKNKAYLLQGIKKDIEYIEPYSPQGRQNYILERLFVKGQTVDIYDLTDELFVSNATIYNDLKQIEDWLQTFHLHLLKRNSIIEIFGKEEDYRKAVASFLLCNKENRVEQTSNYRDCSGRIDCHALLQLKALIDIDYKKIENIVNDLEEKLNFRFAQEAYVSFVIHIAIAMKRMHNGKNILLAEDVINSIKDTKEFEAGRQMSKEIEKAFQVEIPEAEIVYITLHILGSKMHEKDLAAFSFPYDKVEELDLAREIARNIINSASDSLHIPLHNDQALLNGLVLHLRPAINRLKYGLTLRNPILEEIKDNYGDIFGVAWMSSKIFEKYLNAKIPESEIGYITLHLAAAVERNLKKIKALVVCHSGIGTSQLLSERLKRCFKEIELAGVVSSTAITSDLLDQVQIVISTVPLSVKCPVLVISPLFTHVDIKKLEQFIAGLTDEARQNDIKKEYFYWEKKFPNRNQLITEICSKLTELQYVTKDFTESVLLRENMMATEVGRGIAIPHGETARILRSCLVLVVLKHAIMWKKELVEFVLMPCIAEKDLENGKFIFRNLCRQMDNPQFFKEIRNGQLAAEKAMDILMTKPC